MAQASYDLTGLWLDLYDQLGVDLNRELFIYADGGGVAVSVSGTEPDNLDYGVEARNGEQLRVGGDGLRRVWVRATTGGSATIRVQTQDTGPGLLTGHRLDRHEPLSIARDLNEGISALNVTGYNASVGTTPAIIAPQGLLQMPQPANAQGLRVRAGDANDAPGGTGARSVFLSGIDASGNRVAEIVATGGASAGPLSTTAFLRLNECFVFESGQYQSGVTVLGQAATLIIEQANGTAWRSIQITSNLPRNRSQFAGFHVPNDRNAYIYDIGYSAPPDGRTTILGFGRFNNLRTSPPYTPALQFFEKRDVQGDGNFQFSVPIGPFPANSDILFYAYNAQSTSPVAVSFDGVVVREAPFVDINGVKPEDII